MQKLHEALSQDSNNHGEREWSCIERDKKVIDIHFHRFDSQDIKGPRTIKSDKNPADVTLTGPQRRIEEVKGILLQIPRMVVISEERELFEGQVGVFYARADEWVHEAKQRDGQERRKLFPVRGKRMLHNG